MSQVAPPGSAAAPELDRARIDGLVNQVARRDGVDPLDEAEHLALAAGHSGSAVHALLDDDAGALVGYLQLSAPDPRWGDRNAAIVAGGSVGLDPTAVAGSLLDTATALSEPGRLTVWSRSDTSVVAAVAVGRGFRAERGLLTMSRSLSEPSGTEPAITDPPPGGVTIGAFVPGRDEAAWLALNAAAFAAHPEQGAWTATDLARRLEQPWFDPAGFLLAHDAATGELLGFHWTKVHDDGPVGVAPVAEVYVLATAPAAQGRGLGRALLAAGLRHLQTSAAHDVILYVDEGNAAVRLYERAGFVVVRRQVQYRRP